MGGGEDDLRMDQRAAADVDVVELSGCLGHGRFEHGHHPRELAVLGFVVLHSVHTVISLVQAQWTPPPGRRSETQ